MREGSPAKAMWRPRVAMSTVADPAAGQAKRAIRRAAMTGAIVCIMFVGVGIAALRIG